MSLRKLETKSDLTSGLKPVSQKRQMREAIESLAKATHFDKNELEKLSDFYRSEECFHSKLNRSNFLDFLHKTFNITDLLIMDQIFRLLDQDGDGCLNLVEFSKGMSLFLRGTFEETAKFCFDVYDINGDGFISKEEVSQLLKKAIIRNRSDDDNDPDETFKELMELAIKKLDKDGDHKVSRSDFEKAISEEKLLMQCLGRCLPDRGAVHKFEATLFHSG